MAKKNASTRKTIEEQVEKMRQDFEGYQKRKLEEWNKLVAGAQRAANMYKDLIESMGKESEAPRDALVADFMEWLANELATMSDYMTIGRSTPLLFSFMPSLRPWRNAGAIISKNSRLRTHRLTVTFLAVLMRRDKGSSKGSGILEAMILLSLGLP